MGILSCIKRLMRTQAGNTALIFALMLLPLIGAVGIAVDTSRAYSVKIRLQEAIDSAALVGAKNVAMDATQRDEMIENYFWANWRGNYMDTDTPIFTSVADPDTRTVTATAQVQMPTVFMRLFGTPYVTVGTLTSSVSGNNFLEVAIALDNTASMRTLSGGTRRIDLMKTAATNFVNNLYTVNGTLENTLDNMRVSLIPFTSMVNVGSQHTNFLVPNSLNGLVWDYPANTTTQNSWRGCVFERSFYSDGTYGGRDMTDHSPSVEAFFPYHVAYPQIVASTSCASAPSCWPASSCPGGLQANCPDPTIAICTVGGACSTSAGACTSGTPATDNGLTACDTTRTWQCVGAFGGGTSNCSRFNGACNVNGVCGTTRGTCTSGTPANNNGATACGTTTTWECTGNGTGTTASCSFTNPSCTVNGSCGAGAGACSSGTKINDSNTTACETTRTWQCQGAGPGATTADCSFTNGSCSVNGSCGTSGNCSAGSKINDNGLTACGTTRSWQCTGTGSGTTANCSTNNPACSICFDNDGQPRPCKVLGPVKPITLPRSENFIDVAVPPGCRWGNAGVNTGDTVKRPAYSYRSNDGITVQYFGLDGNLSNTYGYNASIVPLQSGSSNPSVNLSGNSACCGYGIYGSNSDVLSDNMYAYAWEPWRAYTMNGRIISPWPTTGTVKIGGWGNSGCGLPLIPLTDSRTDIINRINDMDTPAAANPELGYGGTLINQGLVWAWRTISPNWRGFWKYSNGSDIDSTLPLDYSPGDTAKAVIVMTDGLNFLPDRRARQGGGGPFFFAQRPAQYFTVNDPNLSGGVKYAMQPNAQFNDVDSSAYGLLRHNFDVSNTGLYGRRNPMSFCRQRELIGNVSYKEPHLAAWGCREYDCMLRDSSGNCLRSGSPVSGSEGTPTGTFNFLEAIAGPYYDELTNRLLTTCSNMRANNIRIYFILFAIDDNPQKTAALAAFNTCVGADGAVYDAADGTALNNAFNSIAATLRELRLRE